MNALWVFGYGSLIFRPDFVYEERQAAILRGWTRRFWQGSTDHRGVPGAPGRVVTLVPDPDGGCWGAVYRVAESSRESVLGALDEREKGGYRRLRVLLELPHAEVRIDEALVYVATERNPNYLGPAPLDSIARQVLASRGPSGHNIDYVLDLAKGLIALGAEDAHVFDLAARVEARTGERDALKKPGGRAPASTARGGPS